MVWPPREPGPGTLGPGREPFTQLERAVPIALLPVRLETRWFVTRNAGELELRVRIYPDAIHVVAAPGIRRLERDEAIAYWRARAHADTGADERAASTAWDRLVRIVGEPRAAYLRTALAPTRGPSGDLIFPDVHVDEDIKLPDARGLPDRFVVLGYEQGYRRFAAWGNPVPRVLAVGPASIDDPDRRWQVDFAAAEAVGMAVRIRVERSLAGRLSRIVALGVRETESATAGSTLLAELVEGHARGGGATLLPVGTPTNHTAAARAGASPTESGSPPSAGSDGTRLATALGISSNALRWVGNADTRNEQATRAIHAATWPATWGYFLEHIVGPSVSAPQREAGRRLFIDHVRGHGPFPALCIGRQPYGILPSISLSRWKTGRGDEDLFVRGLGALLPRWHRSGSQAARLPASGDPMPALLDALALQSSSVRWLARSAATPEIASAWWLSGPLASAALGNLLAELRKPIAEELRLFGLFPTPDPVRIDPLVYADQATLLDLPLVTRGSVDEMPEYVRALASMRDLEAIRRHDVPGANPRTLLYLLLRHATLLVASRTTNDLLGVAMSAREEVDVRVARVETVWDRLARPVPGFGGRTARELVTAERPPAHPMFGELADHRAAMAILAPLPARHLERLAAEVLDVCSHRLDAWITAVATRRLMESRVAGVAGTRVGAVGWVDAPPVPASPAHDGALVDDPGHGHVHAPSLDHARTAAMLRAGFVARPEGDLAVDLSSRRVRRARWVLAGLRAGRSLSELLAYRIERALANPLDIADLRRDFPMTGSGIDASSVRLDGLAVFLAWRDQPPIGRYSVAAAEVIELVDGLSDLLMAESVHQHVRGNPERGGVLLEALAAGTLVPSDPDVVRTARDGETTTYQVILSVGEDDGWPGDSNRVRARANPRLNAWLASILGDPHELAVTIRYRANDGALGEVGRSVSDLDMCALDVSALAGSEFGSSQLAALFVAEAPPGATDVEVVAAPRLDEALLLARAFRDCVRGARPLAADDHDWSQDVAAALVLLDATAEIDSATARRRLAATIGVSIPDRAEAVGSAVELAARVRAAPSAREAIIMLSGVAPVGRASLATNSTSNTFPDRATTVTWFADTARVRPSIAALNLLGYGARGRADVAGYGPASGVVQVVVGAQANELDGLILDTWRETRPLRETTSGLAFHHDAPRARAPQSILLAVPPDPTAGWSLSALEATVKETIDLMIARLARTHEVWGPLLPALFFAENLAGETVSTTLEDVAIDIVVRD